jgi:hypothetical protein
MLVGINNYILERIVNIGALMSMLTVAVIRELGIMHLVTRSESHKTTLGVVTQALERIKWKHIKVEYFPTYV